MPTIRTITTLQRQGHLRRRSNRLAHRKQSPVQSASPSTTSGDENVTMYNTLVFSVRSPYIVEKKSNENDLILH
ncbi:unnamed protein product [Brassica oleracea]|uniref:(rape) hypothetical protein n=1 Tax=Brassica napus TaxID=3708 RepID=A0A816N9L0_BRANA|nr:unnamed protein product [Brassica napus]